MILTHIYPHLRLGADVEGLVAAAGYDGEMRLAEEGHDYSSSIYPVHHDLYGMPEAPRFPFRHGCDEMLDRQHFCLSEFFRPLCLDDDGGAGFLLFSAENLAFRDPFTAVKLS